MKNIVIANNASDKKRPDRGRFDLHEGSIGRNESWQYTPSTNLIGLYTPVDGMPATRRKYEPREEAARGRGREGRETRTETQRYRFYGSYINPVIEIWSPPCSHTRNISCAQDLDYLFKNIEMKKSLPTTRNVSRKRNKNSGEINFKCKFLLKRYLYISAI